MKDDVSKSSPEPDTRVVARYAIDGESMPFDQLTDRQQKHLDRKWQKTLKRHYQLNKRMRENGTMPRLDPNRLPK